MDDQPPPLPAREQQRTDTDQLRLLVIFHYIFAGLAVLALAFLILHYWFMNTFMMNPAMWEEAKQQGQQMPFAPEKFFAMFRWFYGFMGVVIVVGGVLNWLSARYIRNRRKRMFSMVVAGLNCLQIPFGTALGIFTFIVMGRSSVRDLYDQPSLSERD